MLLERDIFTANTQSELELLRFSGVPNHMLSGLYRRSNGFFGFEESLDGNGRRQLHITWFRFIVKIAIDCSGFNYVWHELTFVSRWNADQCAILCIGVPTSFKHLLSTALSSIWTRIPSSEPYSLHVPLMEAIISLQDSAVWSIRDIVRNIEKDRSRSSRAFFDFLSLHEAARHAIHSSETLGVSVGTLEAMKKQMLDLLGVDRHRVSAERIHVHMDYQIRVLQNLERRCESNKERLQNEISLAYSMIAQRDSQAMTKLGEAAKIDSGAMRTIAEVTMAFLPPTFLSAIFSTSFFNYTPGEGAEPSRWSVSSMFWIYWVFAIPLTGLTMAAWVWRKERTKKRRGA
ncbi:hypothetical protein EJ04DRAFT_497713 [Polyplosphaeria fusca]|uniref:Uncharacterized protein n=1 Tax=Polyplosphaeria fusca TaxID=682080 RepID=A0A9P4QSS1_9PLEO|nr:hypothetical protein EJ04DRAFT_497713 [Polyplosphaeria fusca]